MKTVGKSANIPESRLSQQNGTNDDVVAMEEEAQEQIEEDHVEKAARENTTDRYRGKVPGLVGPFELEEAS